MKRTKIAVCLFAMVFGSVPQVQAVLLLNSGFTTNTLPANDDGFTGPVAVGFNLNFFGTTYNQLFVNNNGNVTFKDPMFNYTPFGLDVVDQPIIAPFFADVDTRGSGSGLVTYGNDTVNGHSAFGVDWFDVGYFGGHVDKLNQFQLVLVDRSDVNTGDFDIQFNYGNIQWETGDASGGYYGIGGVSAAVGYSNGAGSTVQFDGSLVPGSFIPGGLDALSNRGYTMEVRNGEVELTSIPETSTTLPLLALIALPTLLQRSRRRPSPVT